MVGMLVLGAPALAHAQTCQGMAQFREGNAQVAVGYQHSEDLDYYRAGMAFGAQGSLFGGANLDQARPGNGAAIMNGFGGELGYQFHWSATPFQVCPIATVNYAAGGGVNTTSVGLGGSLGYHKTMRRGFELVPAAGVRWIAESTSGGGGTATTSEWFLDIGLVLNRVWSVVPGVLFPSPASAQTRFTLAFAYNWGL